MKRRASVVIIGGGISGLSIAYNLAKLGLDDIVVVEKKYLGGGSTGKCGTGIRQQFTTKEHIMLMKESVKLWEKLDEELGHDVGYRQTGYLWLIRDEEELSVFKENVNI
ncbi:MAG: FAD-binding oxidoreductase, partial [Thermoprotei archaeon]